MAIYRVDSREASVNWEADGQLERTLQNVKNLLMTRAGEVPYDRLKGVRREVYDMPITQLNARLRQEMEWTLEQEEDAKLVACRAFIDADGATVIEVCVEIEVDE